MSICKTESVSLSSFSLFRKIFSFFVIFTKYIFKFLKYLNPFNGKNDFITLLEKKESRILKLVNIENFINNSTENTELKRILTFDEFSSTSSLNLNDVDNNKSDEIEMQKLAEKCAQELLSQHPQSTQIEYKEQVTQYLLDVAKKHVAYKQLIEHVKRQQKITYSCEDDNHEMQLTQLWRVLNPDEPLKTRKSKQWSNIGFQGEDPETDFRSMGLLGLQQLLNFAKSNTRQCLEIIKNGSDYSKGYPFACAGINISRMMLTLLTENTLKRLLYSFATQDCNIDTFNTIYCEVYLKFDEYFRARGGNVMQFNEILRDYQKALMESLSKQDFLRISELEL